MPTSQDPIEKLVDNVQEVERLLEIHGQLAGDSPGRKYNVEVLNKSAIVLLVACWEAFIEDLADDCFEHLINASKKSDSIPSKVKSLVARKLSDSPNDLDVWQLAGRGWRRALAQHKQTILEKYTGRLNTPKPDQIDRLFLELLGVPRLSSKWRWHSVKPEKNRERLEKLVTLRGSIAHRVSAAESVKKVTVTHYLDFIYRLSVKSSNVLAAHLKKQVNSAPWPSYRYKKTR